MLINCNQIKKMENGIDLLKEILPISYHPNWNVHRFIDETCEYNLENENSLEY